MNPAMSTSRARARVACAASLLGLLALVAGCGASAKTPAATGMGMGGGQNAAAEMNPNLDLGTSLGGVQAPGFRLLNQFGQPMSLSQFRGKVVVLSFEDSECTTVCPLTEQSMLDAKEMLGTAGNQVQLLGVDANPDATSVADVLAYSRAHGVVNRWDFLTGSPAQLKATWSAYHIAVQVEQGQIDHTPALFVIDQRGREQKIYLTQMAYSSIGQSAQVLAQEIATLLPGHPRVASRLSLASVGLQGPADQVTLDGANSCTVPIPRRRLPRNSRARPSRNEPVLRPLKISSTPRERSRDGPRAPQSAEGPTRERCGPQGRDPAPRRDQPHPGRPPKPPLSPRPVQGTGEWGDGFINLQIIAESQGLLSISTSFIVEVRKGGFIYRNFTLGSPAERCISAEENANEQADQTRAEMEKEGTAGGVADIGYDLHVAITVVAGRSSVESLISGLTGGRVSSKPYTVGFGPGQPSTNRTATYETFSLSVTNDLNTGLFALKISTPSGSGLAGSLLAPTALGSVSNCRDPALDGEVHRDGDPGLVQRHRQPQRRDLRHVQRAHVQLGDPVDQPPGAQRLVLGGHWRRARISTSPKRQLALGLRNVVDSVSGSTVM